MHKAYFRCCIIPLLFISAFVAFTVPAGSSALADNHSQRQYFNNRKVRFKGGKSEQKRFPMVSNVRGELRLPNNGNGKFPAVVLLHSSGGYKAHQGEYYAKALNTAGMATLEIDMFARGKRPRRTDLTMSHAFGALEYLKSRPEIDADKIGVTGWSWGGVMSLRMASERMARHLEYLTEEALKHSHPSTLYAGDIFSSRKQPVIMTNSRVRP